MSILNFHSHETAATGPFEEPRGQLRVALAPHY